MHTVAAEYTSMRAKRLLHGQKDFEANLWSRGCEDTGIMDLLDFVKIRRMVSIISTIQREIKYSTLGAFWIVNEFLLPATVKSNKVTVLLLNLQRTGKRYVQGL